jgi:hypothetical protein
LKFGQSFEIGRRFGMQAVRRFLSKFAMDVVRTALASGVCAVLFAHQWTQTTAPASQPETTVAPTSEQSSQIVRDEHGTMTEFLKAEYAKERAAIEREVREAEAAKTQQAVVKQAELDARRAAPIPRSNTSMRKASVDNAPTSDSAARISESAARTDVPAATASVNPMPPSPASTSALAPALPPPTVILAPPDLAASNKADPPHETRENFGQKVAAITHVNDVVSFVRDVSSWFKHDDAPVPPAEVRSPFANADM